VDAAVLSYNLQKVQRGLRKIVMSQFLGATPEFGYTILPAPSCFLVLFNNAARISQVVGLLRLVFCLVGEGCRLLKRMNIASKHRGGIVFVYIKVTGGNEN
jgi:hypothetical protein